MALLSPGVQVVEIDASAIVPTVSNSVAVFGGSFEKGPVGKYSLITNEAELVNFYGYPRSWNYNDFYQCANFLKYGNSLLVSRAANTNGSSTPISGITVTAQEAVGQTVIEVAETAGLTVGMYVTFGTAGAGAEFYRVTAIAPDVSFTIDRGLEVLVPAAATVNVFDISMNGVFEAVDTLGTPVAESAYVGKLKVLGSYDDFENQFDSIAFADSAAGKFKFIARNPGTWGNLVKIAIAKPSDFGTATPSFAFDGIGLDDLFDYVPTGNQLAIIIEDNGSIVEKYTVSTDPLEKDHNNKSIYIENVINNNSNYLFVKENTANTDAVKSYLFSANGTPGTLGQLILGAEGNTGSDDIIASYDVFSNTELVDVDIVIANEAYITAAVSLADTRKDCITFVGAAYGDVVGKKATDAVSALVTARQSGAYNINSMFVCFTGNYVYQYDRYNDVNRWVNVAGHIAGLRAQTSTSRASWFASAGLERGQLAAVIKLAYSPNQAQRDSLYKNSINPLVSFPGQGTVMWGQKTLLSKASSFDRVNVRGLFNTLERSLAKMAKYQVMEFNDNFTRNRIVSMIKPFLSSVKSGRGIEDYLVICDLTNNTPDVISRNELVVDIFIKPTFVAEFIQLRFTNAGTNSFSTVTGG